MPKEVIIPKNVHPTRGYSHAYKCGNTIYVAGQIGWDEEGKLVGEGDVVTQTERAYENLKRVLEAAGALGLEGLRMDRFADQGHFRKGDFADLEVVGYPLLFSSYE